MTTTEFAIKTKDGRIVPQIGETIAHIASLGFAFANNFDAVVSREVSEWVPTRHHSATGATTATLATSARSADLNALDGGKGGNDGLE